MNQQQRPIAVDIAKNESDLEQVIRLYKRQKAVLGLFPDGAFIERLNSRQILIARSDTTMVGYLLFTVNQRLEVRIAHLCVEQTFQRRGIARKLVDRLKADYGHCSRIRLNCRVDFEAVGMWQRLRFQQVRRIPGRKDGGSELIVFHFPLNEMPLFGKTNFEIEEDIPRMVCDANVCMDIEMDDRPRHGAATGLLADWLVDEIALFVTPEIKNDIGRQDEKTRQLMTRALQQNWEEINYDETLVEPSMVKIRSILGKPVRPSAASDQHHLAYAAAGGATAFATNDSELLEHASEILSQLGLRVQKPSGIISEIDSVVRAHRNRYSELAKSGVKRQAIHSTGEVEIDQMLATAQGEGFHEFRGLLDSAFCRPNDWDIEVLKTDAAKTEVLIAARQQPDGVRAIEKFRISHRAKRTRLGYVLRDYCASQPLGPWPYEQRTIVRITDTMLSPELAEACRERGFILADSHLWRLALPGIWAKRELLAELRSLANSGTIPEAIADELELLAESADGEGGEHFLQRLEAMIHPGKLAFGSLPTYILPIERKWAQELFDIRLWERPLFAPETALVLNPDSVYYKRPRNSPTTDHGRILWYVSGKGGGFLAACSVLTKRVAGTVKDLYREYARIGVFDWPQLIQHFGRFDEEALALEFTNTELLPNRMSLEAVNEILVNHEMKKQQFMSTIKIPSEAFQEIYLLATRTR